MDNFYVMFMFIALVHIGLLSYWAKELARKLTKKDICRAKKTWKIGKYRMWFFGLLEPAALPTYVVVLWYMAIIQLLLLPLVWWIYSKFGFDAVFTLVACTYVPTGLYGVIIAKLKSTRM